MDAASRVTPKRFALGVRPCCVQGAIPFLNGEYLIPCMMDLPPLTFTIGGMVSNEAAI